MDRRLDDGDSRLLDHELELEEIIQVIKELPKDKTPGLDGIPGEVLQVAPELAAKKLIKVYRDAFCM
eukprot:c16650_g1_i1 orf=210-410(+)